MSTAESVEDGTPEPPVRLSFAKNPNNIDVLDQLTKLGRLKQNGVLTPEEFDAKKAELRARLW
jgi:Short C-terminal domain